MKLMLGRCVQNLRRGCRFRLRPPLAGAVLVLALSATAQAQGDVAQEKAAAPLNDGARPTLGVIRWDMWGERGRMMTERSLSPAKYHHRIPFFGKINDPHELVYNNVAYQAEVSFGGDTPEVMDRELAYAAEAGIDYFAFVHYGMDAPLSYARALYKKSANKKGVRFTYIVGEPDDAHLPEIIEDMGRSEWMRVLQGRPLLFLMGSEKVTPGLIRKLNAAYETAFPEAPPIYFVLMQYTDGHDMKRRLQSVGAQAGSSYCTWNRGGEGDHTFAGMANQERRMWQTYVEAQANIIPWVTLGFDRRPRIDFVMPWETHQPNNWCENATPAEAGEQIQAAYDFVKRHKPEANTILVYSWNEDDEGQGVVPKRALDGSGVDRRMLDALKDAVARNS